MKRRIDDTLQLVPAIDSSDQCSLILAPLFATAALGGDKLSATNVVFAKGGDYCEGRCAKSCTESAFQFAEALVSHAVATHKPAQLVLLGFSAGAQFWNRFVAVSRTLETLKAQTHVSLVLGTSSSWLYLHPLRINPALENVTLDSVLTASDFTVPEVTVEGYNSWKYGLDNIPTYLWNEGDSIELIRRRVLSYPTTYILVSDDTKGGDSLDSSPQALIQCKSHRFERASIYVHYLRSVCAELCGANGIDVVANAIIVHECGHDAGKVFAQKSVRDVVFGEASAKKSSL
ncbi:UNVERIFIED_CONTAM: hypothetical protein HDU68_000312 [Siphonaria sp. JEL0065]|nr:hypothetical protein HDU68_000312 [Siphonaria sp. JEL0065]